MNKWRGWIHNAMHPLKSTTTKRQERRLQTWQHQSGFTKPIQFSCRPRQNSRKKHPHMRNNCISRLLFLLSLCQSCKRIRWHQKFHNQMQILSHKDGQSASKQNYSPRMLPEELTYSANLTSLAKTIEVQEPFLSRYQVRNSIHLEQLF